MINRLHGAGSIGTIWGGLIAVTAIGLGFSMEEFNLTLLTLNLIMLVIYILLFKTEYLQSKFSLRKNTSRGTRLSEIQLYIIALIILAEVAAYPAPTIIFHLADVLASH